MALSGTSGFSVATSCWMHCLTELQMTTFNLLLSCLLNSGAWIQHPCCLPGGQTLGGRFTLFWNVPCICKKGNYRPFKECCKHYGIGKLIRCLVLCLVHLALTKAVVIIMLLTFIFWKNIRGRGSLETSVFSCFLTEGILRPWEGVIRPRLQGWLAEYLACDPACGSKRVTVDWTSCIDQEDKPTGVELGKRIIEPASPLDCEQLRSTSCHPLGELREALVFLIYQMGILVAPAF